MPILGGVVCILGEPDIDEAWCKIWSRLGAISGDGDGATTALTPFSCLELWINDDGAGSSAWEGCLVSGGERVGTVEAGDMRTPGRPQAESGVSYSGPRATPEAPRSNLEPSVLPAGESTGPLIDGTTSQSTLRADRRSTTPCGISWSTRTGESDSRSMLFGDSEKSSEMGDMEGIDIFDMIFYVSEGETSRVRQW